MASSRYTYDVDSDTFTRDVSSGIPVVDIMNRGVVCVQFGINVPHVRSSSCFFLELAEDGTTSCLSSLPRVLARVNNLMYSDASFSSFSFSRPTTFLVHAQDTHVIAVLNDEATRHRYSRARDDISSLMEEGMDAGLPSIVSTISREPALYPYLLLALKLEDRPGFHGRVTEYFDALTRHKGRLKSAKPIIADISSRVAEITALGISTGAVVSALKGLEKNGTHPLRLLTRSVLDGLYAQVPGADFDYAYHLPFSRVERLTTTLHKRANNSYNPAIVSFRLREPMDLFKRRVEKAGL